MKVIFIFLLFCLLLPGNYVFGAERSTDCTAQQSIEITLLSKTPIPSPGFEDLPISWLGDGLAPFVSQRTGAFWAPGDARMAENLAQIAADKLNKSIFNAQIVGTTEKGKLILTWRKVRMPEKDAEGRIKTDDLGRRLWIESENVWKIVHPSISKSGSSASGSLDDESSFKDT